MTSPSIDATSVGGNVIRYPIAEGFDLDYTVESTQLKQNLVIRERPVLEENVAWFGVTEQMRLPLGYGLFLGDDLLSEEVTQTQEELTIRKGKRCWLGQRRRHIPSMEGGDDAWEPHSRCQRGNLRGEGVVVDEEEEEIDEEEPA